MLRRLAVISATLGVALGFLFGVMPMGAARLAPRPAKQPRYGGTLRIEIEEAVSSLDPSVAAASPEESAAKEQIDSLLYEHRNPDGTVKGPGAFHIAEWEPGKHVVLAANEDYSGGRPFVDRVEIQMGRASRDRMLDLELNKTDLAEIAPEEARRASERGVRVSASMPDELIAAIFIAGRPVTEDARVREAVSRSIDRASIVSFILQKQGEPAGGLLPQWFSGTAFLFSATVDTAGAKDLWSQAVGMPRGVAPRIVLGYDSGDALEKTIAERIAVNAREAGIGVMTESVAGGASAPSADIDVRLMRLRMVSTRPRFALANFISVIGPITGLDAPALSDAASAEQVYECERAIVGSYRAVPLVWLPQVYGVSARVRDWKPPMAGEGWPLADVWLDGEAQ